MNDIRAAIISTMQKFLEADTRALAFWLEGADATGFVDQYSDIDMCCSVVPGAIDAIAGCAQQALESLGRLDLINKGAREEDGQSVTFHLEGTSPYLLIDFDIYIGRGSEFAEGDAIEKPLILFDRGGVIQFVKRDARLASFDRPGRLQALAKTVAQYPRIEKYFKRGDFIEAFGYYHRWLIEPLIEALRFRYTPLHPDYYIVHISRHLPADVLHRLEDLFKVSSLEDLEHKSREALTCFNETVEYLLSKE